MTGKAMFWSFYFTFHKKTLEKIQKAFENLAKIAKIISFFIIFSEIEKTKFSFLIFADYSDESEYDMPEMQEGGQQPSAGKPAHWPSTTDNPVRRPYTAAGDLGRRPQLLDESQDKCPALHTAFARRLLHTGSDTDAGSSSRWRWRSLAVAYDIMKIGCSQMFGEEGHFILIAEIYVAFV